MDSSTDREPRLREFEKLAFPYMGTLYSTALHMTRNAADAEDLVQDVYLRAYRFFDKFKAGTNFRAWIFRVLQNTYINHYWKRQHQPSTVQFDKVEFQFPDSKAGGTHEHYIDPNDSASYRPLFGTEIHAALDRLPEDFRLAVLLAYVVGFRYQEIAEMMDCPVGTVMSRLHRARVQLRKHLESYADREGYIGRGRQLRRAADSMRVAARQLGAAHP